MTMEQPRYSAIAGSTSHTATILGGAVGNLIEWYDWTIYGLLAVVFAGQIVPAANPATSLIGVLLAYAVGFLMRPIGSIVLSPMADKYGRRKMLSLTIILMGIGSLIVAVTPPYAEVGVVAPLMLLAARMLQGFSTGGEFQGSSVYLVEHAPLQHRAFASSPQMVSIGVAILLATATAAVTTAWIPQPALAQWGWRIPFFIGALGAVYGLFLRWRLPETPSFEAVEARGEIVRRPLIEAVRAYPRETMYVFVVQAGTVQFYIWTVFLPSYAALSGGLPIAQGLLGGTITMAVYTAAIPLLAALSDRVGRKPLLYVAVGGFFLLAYPLFSLLRGSDFATFLFVDIVGILLIACSNAVLPAFLCELFPARVRTSGIGLPYALCSAIFGGTAPLIATALLGEKADWAIAAYVMAICLVSLLVFRVMPETRGRALD
jgi:MHS family alpha-ketoglutarate permease-like MFS transporter